MFYETPVDSDDISGTLEVARAVPVAVPDEPGFGVELNEAEAAKHPYGEKNFLRLFEDGWEKRDPG